MFKIKSIRLSSLAIFLAAVVAIVIGILFFSEHIADLVAFIRSEQTHPAFIVLAFLILPIFFSPVSPLLVLIGLRFDTLWGILIMYALMPVHLNISFLVTRKLLYQRVLSFAQKRARRFLTVPEHRHFEFAALFMVIPGLSYSAKNYLLPITGVSYKVHMITGWFFQGLICIPFIVLGDAAAQWSAPLFVAFVLLFVFVFVAVRIVRKRMERMV